MTQATVYSFWSGLSFVFSIALIVNAAVFARRADHRPGVEGALYSIAYLVAILGAIWQVGEGLGLSAARLGM